MAQPQRRKEKAGRNHTLVRESGSGQPLQRSGKARFLQQGGQEARARSSKDHDVRVAGIGRQSLLRTGSGIAHTSYCRSYVLMIGGVMSSVGPTSMQRRSLLWRTL